MSFVTAVWDVVPVTVNLHKSPLPLSGTVSNALETVHQQLGFKEYTDENSLHNLKSPDFN